MVAIHPSRRKYKQSTFLPIRYHGNWVGPGWSAGAYRDSVGISNVKAIDEFDRTGLVHDRAYYTKRNLKRADYAFYRANIRKGLKRSVAAIAVGTQGYFRKKDEPTDLILYKNNKMDMDTSGPSRKRGRSRTPRRRSRSNSMLPTPGRSRRSRSRARSGSRVTFSSTSSMGRKGDARSGNVSKVKVTRANKQSLSKVDKHGKRGCVLKFEAGTTDSLATRATHVFFTTMFRDKWLRCFVGAILRMLLKRGGVDFRSWGDLCTLSSGTFQIVLNPTDTAASSVVTYAFTPGVVTYRTIRDSLTSNLFTFLNSVAFGYRPISIMFFSTNPATVNGQSIDVNLSNVKIKINTKANLKMQNRSKLGTNVDEDAVDRVPVYGKYITGKGSYTQTLKGALNSTGIFNGAYVIRGVTAGDDRDLFEPLTHRNLINAKKMTKLKIEPSEIKYASLSDDFTVSIEQFFIELYTKPGGQFSYGRWGMFSVEKVLEDGTNAVMTTAIEYALDIGMTCYQGKYFLMAEHDY